jgi:hypothetical protein
MSDVKAEVTPRWQDEVSITAGMIHPLSQLFTCNKKHAKYEASVGDIQSAGTNGK